MKTKRIVMISLITYACLFVPCFLFFLISHGKEVYYIPDTVTVNANDTGTLGNLSLSPGIYRVSFDYDMKTDELYGGFCEVTDNFVKAGGLECSGSPVYDGLTRNEFEFYLYDFTDTLNISLTAYGSEINLSGLSVKNTGKLWLVLLTYITFLTVITDLILVFISKIREGSISGESKAAVLVLFVIWLTASIPFLLNKTLSTADNGYHMQRIEGVAAGLLSGMIPVRIEPHWLQGHGYANGVFYCDLFLIFPAVLRIIGFTVTDSYNIYCLVVNLATVLVSFSVFTEIFKKKPNALILTALYTLSVMHFHKFTQFGNIGEGTAAVFLPLVLLGIYRIFYTDTEKEEYRRAFLPLAAGFTGMICCHVLSSEISALVLIIVFILNIKKFAKIKVWRELFKAVGTSFVLSAWFIIPFLDYYLTQDVHVKHVFARTIQEMGLFFPHIYMTFWGDEPKPSGLGIALFAGLAAFLIVRICQAVCKRKEKNSIRDFADAFFVIAVIMTAMSLECFPWDAIQSVGGFIGNVVSSIQFPSRFLEWGTLAAVSVFGYLLVYFEEKKLDTELKITVALALLSLLFSSVYLNDVYLSNNYRYTIANVEGIGNGYISGAEYILQGTDEEKLHYSNEIPGTGVKTSGYEAGALKARFFAENTTDSDSFAEVPFLNYKGYRAKDSNGNRLEVTTGENNLVRVIIPAGFSGEISVKFVSPIYWRISEIISLLGLPALIAVLIKNRKLVRKRETLATEENNGNGSINIKALTFARSAMIFVMTILLALMPVFTDDNIRHTKSVFLIPLAVIIYYLAIRFVLSLFCKKKEEKIIADFAASLYILSPLCIYTLFNRYSAADFGTLCFPLFSGKDATGIFEIPLKTALLFNTFIYKGAYNYKLYLAHPIQLSPTFVMMVIGCILAVAVRISKKKKAIEKSETSLIIFLLLTECVWFIGTLPLPFAALSNVSGVLSPVGIAALSNVLNSIAAFLFMKRIADSSLSENKKKLIIGILLTTAFLSAVFHLNGLYLESRTFIY